MKILIVEENKEFISVATLILRKANHEVLEAHSLEEALDILEKEPDIKSTITPLSARISGFSLAREIQKMGHCTKIILLTTPPDNHTREQAYKLGIANIDSKFNFLKAMQKEKIVK